MIIIGNILALIASIFMVLAGLVKNRKKTIYIQSIQVFLFILSNAFLKGITGVINNIVSFIRNILCYKDAFNFKIKITLISVVTYTFFMDIKDLTKFKLLNIFATTLWLIYDIFILSYTSAIFDFMCIIANIITILKIKRGNN